MAPLQGKVAIVTGGAAGFGEAIVRSFVAEGARVVIADLAEDKGRALAAELGTDAALFVACDVASGSAVSALVRACVERFGAPHIVVNKAGTTHPNRPMLEVDEATFDRLFEGNGWSVASGCSLLRPCRVASG